ncbi:MAG: ATP-grasp domain-containing protein [Methylococcales bacterium]|nr:ATP-grasp domain-containing protein [Methylococcales bacterium]MDD5631070.1 ATP-grasp domain-containing protein [Methylococcales bacterium]
MKILVFEYITGGGFNKQELPDSLASEGRLMLQALLDNLRSSAVSWNQIAVTVMLDSRVNGSINTTGFDTVIIKPEQNSHEEFTRLVQLCDAVWPIAPEFDGILQTLCQTVESLGKKLLTSPAVAVEVTGDKFKTYQHLKQHHIATVPTQMFTSEMWDDQYLAQALTGISTAIPNCKAGQWLVKPVDGAGCTDSYLLTDRYDFEQMLSRKGRYIIQPHIQGEKTSLSCLFKDGVGWVLCDNLQTFDIINQQYQLSKIIVNHDSNLSAYQVLVDTIARALPNLWGYAGIDLIETPEQVLVLEINPRLTTSFVGIDAALGINVAENVLQLLRGKPTLKAVRNQPITLSVKL